MVATSTFQVGQRLFDYNNVDVLVRRVASGGFGEVAMGPNRANNGKWSALKVLRPELLAHIDAGSRTTAEARLRASFLHEALT